MGNGLAEKGDGEVNSISNATQIQRCKSGQENTLQPRKMEKDAGNHKIQYDTWRVSGRKQSSAVTSRGKDVASPFTSSVGAHRPRIHCVGECEAGRRLAPRGKGHHTGAEGVEAGHHRGHRRLDGEVGSPRSGAAGVYGVHSHLHSTLGGRGWVTVHGSGPGGCIHAAQGICARNHPWEGTAGEENGPGSHGMDGLHSSGSGKT